MSYYNDLAHTEDRIFGNSIQKVEIANFRDYLFDIGAAKLKQVGRDYTWTNSHLFGFINRAIVNST